MTAECAVRGCSAPATIIVQPFRHKPTSNDAEDVRNTFDWGVCAFHERAIVAGEPYAFEGEHDRVILMGADVPPRLINYRVRTEGISDSVVTLVFGRDGIETQSVAFQVSEEFARALFPSEEGNLLADEAERNRASEA